MISCSNNNYRVTVLGSGSGGNSFVIGTPEGFLMIDAGFSRRELVKRLKSHQNNPEEILGVLLTHEHDDHLRGARVFCDEYDIPFYLSMLTDDKMNGSGKLPRRRFLFQPGSRFQIGSFSIMPFAVPHDAADPVGFVIEHDLLRLGLTIDIGGMELKTCERLLDCDMLILEANYDTILLRDSNRSLALKRRIAGRIGHMGNRDLLDVLPLVLSQRTKALCLAHISSECNRYDLVQGLIAERLSELGRQDIETLVAEQDRSMECVLDLFGGMNVN